MKIGFIGAGNMGSALAAAAAKCPDCELYIYDIDKEKQQSVADRLSASIADSATIAGVCDFIFLAVKPKFVSSVISELRDTLNARSGFTIVSMAAGVRISSIETAFGAPCPIIRIMPNTPVAVGKGVVLTVPNANVSQKALDEFKRFMAHSGDVELTDESLIDAGTALSGCSPAFVYMFIDALANGAETAGLDRDTARKNAAKTLIGAAELLLASGKEPEELRDAVCSPGGSTIEGVKVLQKGDLCGLVESAVAASFKRTKELG